MKTAAILFTILNLAFGLSFAIAAASGSREVILTSLFCWLGSGIIAAYFNAQTTTDNFDLE